jgi:16S rRNA processing protein RimM
LNGAFRIELMLEDDRIFEPGRRLILATPGERTVDVEFFRRQHGRCVIKFRGIDTISEAQQYVASEIRIPASELAAPKEGWFYTFQLKGCSVFAMNGDYLGIVTDVLDLGGTEILKVDRDSDETLIPFASSYMKKIDVHQRRIEVDLPEGLRDLNK